LVAAGEGRTSAISYQPAGCIYRSTKAYRLTTGSGTLVATPLNCLLALTDGPHFRLRPIWRVKRSGSLLAVLKKRCSARFLTHHGLSLEDVELVNVELVTVAVSDVRSGRRRHRCVPQFRAEPDGYRSVDGTCFLTSRKKGLPPYDELIYVAKPRHDGQRHDRTVSGSHRESDANIS